MSGIPTLTDEVPPLRVTLAARLYAAYEGRNRQPERAWEELRRDSVMEFIWLRVADEAIAMGTEIVHVIATAAIRSKA